MKTRVRLLLVFGALAAALLLLVSQGFRGTMVYSITVSEMLERGEAGRLKGLRIMGNVVQGSIDHRPTENTLRFEMSDGEATLPVVYRGIVPDTFGDMGEVTVEGSYTPGGDFQASFLMAKCPSKYEMDTTELEGEHPAGSAYGD
jgi:cytochrome c-type biogenesis protein CcmE